LLTGWHCKRHPNLSSVAQCTRIFLFSSAINFGASHQVRPESRKPFSYRRGEGRDPPMRRAELRHAADRYHIPRLEGVDMKVSMKSARRLARAYRVTNGRSFRLKDVDPGDTHGIARERAREALKGGVALLSEMQEKLYAQDKEAVLLIFQAMDAAGKDGTIKHVLTGVNPQGCQVFSFKQPSAQELDHDYLWRATRCLPERGRIGIFNRSYYEEVTAVRVHPEFLAAQRLPEVNGDVWKRRFDEINHFERYLNDNGILILKFFLYVSKKEQRKRFLARLDEPDRNWKFSIKDVEERRLWNKYHDAYEQAIRHTATRHAPWFVVPADHKWFTRIVVAAAIATALDDLKLAFPTVTGPRRAELRKVRTALAS
jgi:PPK2 family polyphosphate:nucleotide phosphotransferase